MKNRILNNVVLLSQMPIENRGYVNEKEVQRVVVESIEKYFRISFGKRIEECIMPNDCVIIKPNFVSEMNFNVSRDGKEMENPNDCFITNITVIKAILLVLNRVKGLKVKMVESPMQFCKIDEILTSDFWTEITNSFDGEIEFVDLRRTVITLTKEGMVASRQIDRRKVEDYIDFDLCTDSMHLKNEKYVKKFRVTDYPPKEMLNFHGKGKHTYRIAKELIEADWIISVPKLKTHMKAGITGAMKNFVGVVGNKECLPHHIKGSPCSHGDCYKDFSLFKCIAENLLDYANGFLVDNEKKYLRYRHLAAKALALNYRLFKNEDVAGAWWGNDTIWRTVHDLNVIMYYGKLDGSFSSEPVRNVITITDAIVSGEKEGPMRPWPVYTNAITIGSSTYCTDLVNAALMKFDGEYIFHLNEVKNKCKYPLADYQNNVSVFHDEKIITIKEVHDIYGQLHEAASGWKDKLN